jgi:hypothetical protein
MRPLLLVIGAGAVAAGAATLPVEPAGAVCSVFDRHPCAPSVCSVFRRHPCSPEFEYPIGQDLRLTIESRSRDRDANTDHEGANRDAEQKLDTIAALFAAIRECWVPPPEDEARPGMQMSVRFSFKRSGEIIGTPRTTYVTPNTPREARETYRNAVTASLHARAAQHRFGRRDRGAPDRDSIR